MKKLLIIFLALTVFSARAQLKFILDDFEGIADHAEDLKPNGIFCFGNIKAAIERKLSQKKGYSGERCLRLTQNSTPDYGGWGKGVTQYVELDVTRDYLNFYLFQPSANGTNRIIVELQEDDNGDAKFEKDNDDSWQFDLDSQAKDNWELVSIPLSSMKDSNKGGDGIFNVGYKSGKLLCFIITFASPENAKPARTWLFDFVCFSKGKLPVGAGVFDAGCSGKKSICSLGTWSREGNTADFSNIAFNFENNFKNYSDKKLGVIHFFQPFAVDGGVYQNFYPSVERINKVIADGYVPLITLEDHFANAKPGFRQPNLYSITEGYYDSFFSDWAKEIKKVKGTVMLRILHEFNGDWYPWCIAKNDNNPELLVKAYKHIHDIFRDQKVDNVKFVWCPNSTSFPQESWNFIVDAYPGDDYVDFVALDVYNGAGKENSVWRSFRKEGIENYFILTQMFPDKPMLICETASRERRGDESQTAQSKSEWIRDMSDALATDMSGIKLLTWFNEKESFKVNSSPASQKAFLNYVMKCEHFASGKTDILRYLNP